MSKKTADNEKRGFFEYLSVKTELPSDALCGEVRVEMRGRNLVFLSGCRRIIKYSAEEMILAVKGDLLSVKGTRLICSSYHGGTVSIEGSISSVSFEGGDEA